jgi:hypothetical protein
MALNSYKRFFLKKMSKEREIEPRGSPVPQRGRDPDGFEGLKLIRSEDDIGRIRYPSEQEFARLLLRKNPHLIIIYEPQRFEYTSKDGQTKATLPDFLIINPRNSNTRVYVEITCSRRGTQSDVKERQKMVMQKAAPDVRYIVLYREHLMNMQRKNSTFDPFRQLRRAA